MITVYGGNNCKYCTMVKMFLEANGADFTYLNIDEDETANAEWSKLGVMAKPVTVCCDKVITGFNRDELAELLGL